MKNIEQEATYTVQQVAEMLKTNPETVRRWIRSKKLNASQVSRKDGNVISEDELQKFLKTSPKYIGVLAQSISTISPLLGVATFAGTLAAGAIVGYKSAKDKEYSISSKDLKKYLENNISNLENAIIAKEKEIEKAKSEIEEYSFQIKQQRAVLSNDVLIQETINLLKNTMTKGDK